MLAALAFRANFGLIVAFVGDTMIEGSANGESWMKDRFRQLAAYNQWANARLYEAAMVLSETDYRRDVGAFFRSMHGTLNHLLFVDRLWLKRLTGEGEHPDQLDAILYENRVDLALARADEDERIIGCVGSLDDSEIDGLIRYENIAGKRFEQRRGEILTHLFNHQTHHRGQAHMILSVTTGNEPPPLDFVYMQRGVAAPDLRSIAPGAQD